MESNPSPDPARQPGRAPNGRGLNGHDPLRPGVAPASPGAVAPTSPFPGPPAGAPGSPGPGAPGSPGPGAAPAADTAGWPVHGTAVPTPRQPGDAGDPTAGPASSPDAATGAYPFTAGPGAPGSYPGFTPGGSSGYEVEQPWGARPESSADPHVVPLGTRGPADPWRTDRDAGSAGEPPVDPPTGPDAGRRSTPGTGADRSGAAPEQVGRESVGQVGREQAGQVGREQGGPDRAVQERGGTGREAASGQGRAAVPPQPGDPAPPGTARLGSPGWPAQPVSPVGPAQPAAPRPAEAAQARVQRDSPVGWVQPTSPVGWVQPTSPVGWAQHGGTRRAEDRASSPAAGEAVGSSAPDAGRVGTRPAGADAALPGAALVVPAHPGQRSAAPADGPAPAADRPRTGRRAAPDDERGADGPASAGPGRPGDVAQDRITIWDDEAISEYRTEWHDLKAQFVDDPVAALNRAHHLLTEAVQELSEALLAERDDLDPLRRSTSPDTESMRVAMRGYREFLDRILSL